MEEYVDHMIEENRKICKLNKKKLKEIKKI